MTQEHAPDLASTRRLLASGNLRLPPVLASRDKGRIGLLGGSFNPAHRGHLHISRLALRHLGLDEVWWLVSPQNPLKSADDMASLELRLEQALAVATDRRIKVTPLESALGTRYTADTLTALARRFPRQQFVWLMGGDNLADIGRWARWERIFRTVPIAVFARPAYSLAGLHGSAARRFAADRVPPHLARGLASLPPPAWAYFATRLDPLSATAIRRRSLWLPGGRRSIRAGEAESPAPGDLPF